VFWVGLLNTLLVSGWASSSPTLLGFVIASHRLSKNWLVAKLATVYIEVFRNIPLLLQIFFWYFAVLRAVPSPRQSLSLGDAVFLNIRGLYSAESRWFEAGFWSDTPPPCWRPLVAMLLLRRWATGGRRLRASLPHGLRSSPCWRSAGAGFRRRGLSPVLDYPELQGFNFGAASCHSGTGGPGDGAVHLHRGFHR